MTQKQAIQLFEQWKVRTVWDDDAGKWYVAIVDVVAVLTDSIDAAAYWRKLKQRLKAEGNETVTSCHGLKMPAADGKMRMTDVADTEQLFRLEISVDPFAESRTVQAVAGVVGARAAGRAGRPRTRYRPDAGILPPQRILRKLD